MKTVFGLLCFSFVLLVSLAAKADIVWAVAGPYTGDVAATGLTQQAGIKQAIADINAAGGVGGQKITAVFLDDACDPKQAVAVASKIISQNIHFALHGSCSGASLAALKTYIDEGTLVINPCSSNDKITDEGGPNMFRATYRDDKAAFVLSDYIVKHDARKKLVILNDKSAYGAGVARQVKELINKAGMHEISYEAYDPGNHDYSALVTHLKDLGAETIFIGGYPLEIALITRQLCNSGSTAQIIAGDLSPPEFWKITGNFGDNALFVLPSDPRQQPTAKDVIEKLQKSGTVVDAYTLYGYAAAQVLAQAMAKAGSQNPAEVAAVIHKDSFATILGAWTFDAKGDVNNIHQVMYRWHDGKYAELEE